MSSTYIVVLWHVQQDPLVVLEAHLPALHNLLEELYRKLGSRPWATAGEIRRKCCTWGEVSVVWQEGLPFGHQEVVDLSLALHALVDLA